MAVDIRKYSMEIRRLCEEYYRNNISYIDFRKNRDLIFDAIDEEQGVVLHMDRDNPDDEIQDNMLVREDAEMTHE